MKKKIMALCLCFAMAAIAIVGGTLAYFTDTGSAKNVMAMGDLKIVQNEQQRAVDEEGKYTGELTEFVDGKLMLPAVYKSNTNNDAWNNPTTYGGAVNVNGTDYTIFGDDVVKNAVDKIVTVTNNGTIPAYVRTLFAFEDTGDMSAKVHYAFNANDKGEQIYFPSNNDDYLQFTVTDADGHVTTYTVGYYVYDVALAAKTTSEPSLLQVFFDKSTTNADIDKANGSYEILVLSQAVQADGFADADTALNEAFGEITYDADALVAGWFKDVQ